MYKVMEENSYTSKKTIDDKLEDMNIKNAKRVTMGTLLGGMGLQMCGLVGQAFYGLDSTTGSVMIYGGLGIGMTGICIGSSFAKKEAVRVTNEFYAYLEEGATDEEKREYVRLYENAAMASESGNKKGFKQASRELSKFMVETVEEQRKRKEE